MPSLDWRSPEREWTKCNADGAFYAERGQGATVVVHRNDTGGFIAGRAQNGIIMVLMH